MERLTQNERRRKLGAESIWKFAKVYLDHYLEAPPSRLHFDIYDLFENLDFADPRQGSKNAIAAPRGSAKSTLVTLILPLWCICYEKKHLIVLIGDAQKQANTFLEHIKEELENNEKLLADFPEICGAPVNMERLTRTWKSDEIVTKNDIKVVAKGTLGKIRGIRHRQHRPGLIICDDLENDESVKTAEQRRKIKNWFNKAVIYSTAKKCHHFVIGTILHYDSLLSTLINPEKSAGWQGKKYKSVISWAENSELWDSWAAIYNAQAEHLGESGALAAERYYKANQAEMDAGTAVLWPENENYYDLMLEWIESPAAFNSERQNEPINPEDCYFQEDDFHYWTDKFDTEAELLASIKQPRYVAAVDPSLGKHGDKGDYTAIITLVQDETTKILYVIDCIIRRMKPDTTIRNVIDLYKDRKHSAIYFETVAFQDFMRTELEKRAQAENQYPPIIDVKPNTNKLARIQSLQPLVGRGVIMFSRKHSLLLQQLKQFPKDAHDDGPDALEMAVRAAESVVEPNAEIIDVDSLYQEQQHYKNFINQFRKARKMNR